MGDTDKAMRVIEQEKQTRIATCQDEINKILIKNKCQIQAEILLKAGQVIPNIVIVAIE